MSKREAEKIDWARELVSQWEQNSLVGGNISRFHLTVIAGIIVFNWRKSFEELLENCSDYQKVE